MSSRSTRYYLLGATCSGLAYAIAGGFSWRMVLITLGLNALANLTISLADGGRWP
jgi:hypothetical protein